jgi:hypothetical protein
MKYNEPPQVQPFYYSFGKLDSAKIKNSINQWTKKQQQHNNFF